MVLPSVFFETSDQDLIAKIKESFYVKDNLNSYYPHVFLRKAINVAHTNLNYKYGMS